MTALAGIIDEARTDFDNLGGWLRQFSERHLPALEAEAQRLQASPVAQALEAAVGITPDEEQLIASLVTRLSDLHAAQPATAVSEVPATTSVNIFGTETVPGTSEAADGDTSAASDDASAAEVNAEANADPQIHTGVAI